MKKYIYFSLLNIFLAMNISWVTAATHIDWETRRRPDTSILLSKDQDFVEFAKPLLVGIQHNRAYMNVVGCLEKVQTEDRQKFTEMANVFLEFSDRTNDSFNILNSILIFPPSEWDSLAVTMRPFIRDISKSSLSSLLRVFKNIPECDRSQYLHTYQAICPKIKENRRVSLMETISMIPSDYWEHMEVDLIVLHSSIAFILNDEIPSLLQKIEKEERANIIRSVSGILQRSPDHEGYCWHLLNFFRLFPLAQRLEAEKEIEKLVNLSPSRFLVHEVLKLLTVHQRLLYTYHVFPFLFGSIQDCSTFDLYNSLKTLSLDKIIAHNNMISSLMRMIKSETQRIHMILLLDYLPQEFYGQLLDVLINKQADDSEYFDKMPKTRYFQVDLLKDTLIHGKLIQCWQKILLSPDMSAVRETSMKIIDSYPLLGLLETDLIVQEALRALILLNNSQDPLNPYNLHKRLLEKREEVINFEACILPRETVDDKSVFLNPLYLKNLKGTVIHISDLPPYTKSFLFDIRSQLDLRFGERSNNPEIKKSWEELSRNSLEGDYLESLLAVKGELTDPVNLIVAKFVAVVSYLESLTNNLYEDCLSEREEKFLFMLSGIQHCKAGKDGGIEYAYDRLPYDRKYKSLSISKGHNFLEDVIRSVVRAMFSGTNHFFKELTERLPDEDINQPIHQALYVKNLIGDEVGLDHALNFDNHSQTLNVFLVSKLKSSILNTFYKCFVPHVFIQKVMQEINHQIAQGKLNIFYLLSQVMNEEKWANNAWDVDIETCKISIQEGGVLQLLLTINALSVES